ncbi:hypothetical protein SXCC_03941 [Gluconacetobacter sp. SXCC-1]|nr:hypothetical protein SXCC_03941 [Gluconacetobacter sp. SXCC-1]
MIVRHVRPLYGNSGHVSALAHDAGMGKQAPCILPVAL